MKSDDTKKEQIREILNNSFVDNYKFFKETIDKINSLFERYGIDFEYDYNTFCKEYIDKCINVIDDNPDIDLTENKYFLVYGAVAASMVLEKEKGYNGRKEEDEEHID